MLCDDVRRASVPRDQINNSSRKVPNEVEKKEAPPALNGPLPVSSASGFGGVAFYFSMTLKNNRKESVSILLAVI